jgi:hypothetical protein
MPGAAGARSAGALRFWADTPTASLPWRIRSWASSVIERLMDLIRRVRAPRDRPGLHCAGADLYAGSIATVEPDGATAGPDAGCLAGGLTPQEDRHQEGHRRHQDRIPRGDDVQAVRERVVGGADHTRRQGVGGVDGAGEVSRAALAAPDGTWSPTAPATSWR